MPKVPQFIEKYFTLWIVLFSIAGLIYPSIFKEMIHYIPLFLGIIMFGMGTTLQLSDFITVFKYPRAFIIGIVAQYAIMPAVAFILCLIFNLPSVLAIGVILVGTCPGGTASNVITYLARGNVPLSVAMTTASTVISPFMTPLLTYIYAGRWIHVDVLSMFISILQIIVLPIALGLGMRLVLKEKINYIIKTLPSLSILAIALIIAVIIAANSDKLPTVGLLTIFVVVIHNSSGLLLGYWTAILLRLNKKAARTISIEVGMQNSGLAVSLAIMHFGALSAIAGAIFSVWQNLSGSILASWWRKKDFNL